MPCSSSSMQTGASGSTMTGWSAPSVQERRAIIHAAKDELENLKELLDVLESES